MKAEQHRSQNGALGNSNINYMFAKDETAVSASKTGPKPTIHPLVSGRLVGLIFESVTR